MLKVFVGVAFSLRRSSTQCCSAIVIQWHSPSELLFLEMPNLIAKLSSEAYSDGLRMETTILMWQMPQ